MGFANNKKKQTNNNGAEGRDAAWKHVLFNLMEVDVQGLPKALEKVRVKSLKTLLCMNNASLQALTYEKDDGTSYPISESDLNKILHLRQWVIQFEADNGTMPTFEHYKKLSVDDFEDYMLKCTLSAAAPSLFPPAETMPEYAEHMRQAKLAVEPATITAGVAVADVIGRGIGYLVDKATEKSDDNTGRILTSVEQFKKEYGDGISSLVVFKNQSGFRLHNTSCNSTHGRFWKFPAPASIDAGGDGCFLHVHSDWSLYGSEGSATYGLEVYDDVKKMWKETKVSVELGWETPYSGTNHFHTRVLGGEIISDTGTKYDGSKAKLAGTVGGDASPIYNFVISQAIP